VTPQTVNGPFGPEILKNLSQKLNPVAELAFKETMETFDILKVSIVLCHGRQ